MMDGRRYVYNVVAIFVNIYGQVLMVSQKSLIMFHNQIDCRLYPKSSKHGSECLMCQTMVKYM